jgi:pyrroline-5-carboxylate reductase
MMTKKQQQETLIKLYTLWNALVEQGVSQGMNETEAARYASREMDGFISEVAHCTSK